MMNVLLAMNTLLLPMTGRADPQDLAGRIVHLRSELEGMSREMESEQREGQSALDLWVQKKAELQAALQKEKLRRLQLEEKIKRVSERVRIEGRRDPAARAYLKAWLDEARAWVQNSLPFRREIRLATLDDLSARAAGGLESPEVLVAELWQFYEAEMRMAGDNEYRIMDLPLALAGRKGEVVRLGMFALYARLPNGQITRAVRDSDGRWAMAAVPTSGPPAESADRLFANFKNKRDSGLYYLTESAMRSK